MANTKFIIKQHDLEPPLRVTLLDGTEAVDLSAVSEVRFLMKSRSTGLKVDDVMTVEDQSNPDNWGKVSYTWQSGDTDTVGTFTGEIQVMWIGSRPQTFPANKYFTIDIQKDLGP